MIPLTGRAILDLHLKNARESSSDPFAEEEFAAAAAILGYACAVDHLTPAEYSSELVMIQLTRAQRAHARTKE
jgi:hypothetical protein